MDKENTDPTPEQRPAARSEGPEPEGERADGAGPSTGRNPLESLKVPGTAAEADVLVTDFEAMALEEPSYAALKVQMAEVAPFLSAREKVAQDPEGFITQVMDMVPTTVRPVLRATWEVSKDSSTDPAVPRRRTPTQQRLLDAILGAALTRATGSLLNPIRRVPRTHSTPSVPNTQKLYQRVSYADAALFVDPDRRSAAGSSSSLDAPGRTAWRNLELFAKSHNLAYKGPGEMLMHALAIAIKSPEAPAMRAWLDSLMDKDSGMPFEAFRAAWQERWASEVRTREARARDQLLAGQVTQSTRTMTEYVGVFRGIMLEVPHMHESDRIRLFIQGMSLHYRKWCACDFTGTEFTTLNAAISHALGIERRNMLAADANPPPPRSTTPSNRFQRHSKPRFASLQGKRVRENPAPMDTSDHDSDGGDGAGPSNPRFARAQAQRKGGARKDTPGSSKPKAFKAVKAGVTFNPDSKASSSQPPAKKPRKGDPNAPSNIHFLDGRKLKMKDVWRCYDEGYCFNCFEQGHRAAKCPKSPKRFKDGR